MIASLTETPYEKGQRTKKSKALQSYVFTIEQVAEGHNWVASFVRNGVERVRISEPNSYEFCSAIIHAELHMAPFE